MKLFFYKKTNSLINLILSLLGFGAACSVSGCAYGTPAMEYGTPYATFKVKGTVKSEKTSGAISNIRVVMRQDTSYTTSNGSYEVTETDFPRDQIFYVEFKDIDSTTNGDFQSLDTIVEFVNPEFKGGDGDWNEGETEKELNITLKNKE